MAEQIINTIKPLLIEGIKQEINKHKNDFDAVEKGIDDVIDTVEGKIKPIADPIVSGIKMLPFGNPNDRLDELNTEIDKKIDSIDLSDIKNIEGLPKDIKDRVASIPDKVKTELKESIDNIISGEDKLNDSSSTTTSASTITPDTSSNTTKEIESSFSSLSTDQQNEARKEIIRTLINDKVFNNNEHIIEFINIIQKANVTPPESANAEQPQQAIESKVETGTNTSAAANTNMPPVPPSTDNTITPSSTNGGAPKKQRRKTKKNIRRQLNKSTRFGRAF
jgi:hypothetical protein